MSDNIVKFYGTNAADNPDAVLEQAVGEYGSLIIIGYDKKGRLDARSSTNIKQSDILWIIESFKTNMMNGDYSKEVDA